MAAPHAAPPAPPKALAPAPGQGRPAPPAQAPAPGQVRKPAPVPPAQGGPPADLGPDYVIEHQIGVGSFAVVWLARKGDRSVAVKAVDRGRLTKKLRANLEDEIRILGSVTHPNLVAFVDAVQQPAGRSAR